MLTARRNTEINYRLYREGMQTLKLSELGQWLK